LTYAVSIFRKLSFIILFMSYNHPPVQSNFYIRGRLTRGDALIIIRGNNNTGFIRI